MISTKNIMSNILENIDKNVMNTENGDYINEADKLIYCGLCHTPKQKPAEVLGEIRNIPINCECRAKEKREFQEKMEENQRKIRISNLREKCFDDKLLLNQTFEEEDGTLEHKDLGLKYVEKFDQMYEENIGLILTGDVGTGKTYLASAIANALIDKGISVKMTNFSIILNDMMNLEINKNKYIDDLNRNKLLIIDDFGMERDTSFASEHIFNIIDSRYRANKPLIITTNLSITTFMKNTQLKEQRIYSRILEMSTPVIFTGKNNRISKMKNKAHRAKELLY